MRAVSTGTAKATPTLASTPESAIWAGIPTRAPVASRSAPPELPWLTAASVCTAPVIVKPLGASMLRPSPEAMPALADPWYPNGSPIARTGWPTLSDDESPSGMGSRSPAGTSMSSGATSVEGSVPTIFALTVSPEASSTFTAIAPSTTWSLVRTCPWSSMTTPEPSWTELPPGPRVARTVAMIDTTPARRRA